MLRCLSAEIWGISAKNLKNWDITKNVWLDPSIRIYKGKFATKSIWWKIMVFFEYVLKISWNWPNWEQLRALVYSVNLYHPRPYHSTHKSFGQCYDKNLLIFLVISKYVHFCLCAVASIFELGSQDIIFGHREQYPFGLEHCLCFVLMFS